MGFLNNDNYKVFQVRLDKINDIKRFVSGLTKTIGRINAVSHENYNVDARSLIGLFSLDLSEPITIECEDRDFDIVYDICEELGILVKE